MSASTRLHQICEALRDQRQCDDDGVLCIISRQAACEAADMLPELYAALVDVSENVKEDSPKMWARVDDALAKARGETP